MEETMLQSSLPAQEMEAVRIRCSVELTKIVWEVVMKEGNENLYDIIGDVMQSFDKIDAILKKRLNHLLVNQPSITDNKEIICSNFQNAYDC